MARKGFVQIESDNELVADNRNAFFLGKTGLSFADSRLKEWVGGIVVSWLADSTRTKRLDDGGKEIVIRIRVG